VLVVVVVGVVDVVPGLGWQDSVSDATGPVIGSWIDESGVPAGTFTGNVRICPVISLTVIVQESAEAFGIAAMAIETSTAPTRPSTAKSFRLFSNVARFLP
jgi:hypothetical protein